MANGLNKHHILEAIDKLRSRKSRPDAFRIVSYVSKKYEFPKNDIKEYLEKLSKDGIVLKVEFKGSFSYRNAANHRNTSAKLVSSTTQESNHESISDLVTGALARLIVEEPDYLDVGISINELYDHIDNKIKKTITKSYFREVLQKEVRNGNLVKFENGNYCLGYPTSEHNSISPNVSDASQNSVDTRKEKSKSPILSIRKYSCLSRHSSSSSKHSSSSDKTSLSINKSSQKSFTKKKGKELVEELDKSEISPNRESRRKRFQKIVFDPSDSPKPRKLKDKKPGVITPSPKLRGPYKKQGKEADLSSEKGAKKVPLSGTRHSSRILASELKQDGLKAKEEAPSEDDLEEPHHSRNHCKICGFSINFKSSRAMERWTSCHFCGIRAHVTCIEDTEQWTRFKLSRWQCNDCKCCVACQKKNKETGDSKLILCVLCDDAYHYSCANLKRVPHKWFCNKCCVFKDGVLKTDMKSEKDEFGSREVTSNESSQRTTPEPEEKKVNIKEIEEQEEEEQQQQQNHQEEKEKEVSPESQEEEEEDEEEMEVEDGEIDETIPDCSNWSSEDVYEYFSKYVLPEEANVFRDQEIDGKVLLLLNRYDVLSDFKLKLGPALKIYAQVKKLQVRKNDPYLFWP